MVELYTISPFAEARASRSVVVKLQNLTGELVITTAFPAVTFKFALALISGSSVLVLVNLFAVITLVTLRLFSTVKSLLIVTAGVIVIPLESEESNTLDVNVKLPRVAGCTAVSALVPCADVAASVIPYPANVVGVLVNLAHCIVPFVPSITSVLSSANTLPIKLLVTDPTDRLSLPPVNTVPLS